MDGGEEMIEAKLLRSLLSLTKAGAAADNLLIDVREIGLLHDPT